MADHGSDGDAMPRCKEHREFGSICGGTAALVRAQDQDLFSMFCEVIGGAGGGWIGGQIPDWLEPSRRNPRHRGICHSELSVASVYHLGKRALRKWETSFREAADRLEAKASIRPEDTFLNICRRIVAVLCRILAGFLMGLIAGYVSHIVLDADTKMSIGLLGILKSTKFAI
jgi:hypothetical protein